MMQMTEKVQEEISFLKDLKGQGGPTHPLEWFCDVSHLNFNLALLKDQMDSQSDALQCLSDEVAVNSFENDCKEYVDSIYPLLSEMYSEKVKDLLGHAGIDITKPTKFAKGTMYLIYISEEVRHNLNIDDVLCLYLIDVAESVIVNFYKLAACFVQLLRSCIN